MFDWARIDAQFGSRLLLAGGLSPENVAAAISIVRPYGVDVCGGVESAPGKKDADKIAAFIGEVNGVRPIEH